jgi:hypothetical protein
VNNDPRESVLHSLFAFFAKPLMMLTEGLEKKMLELLYSGSERADKTSRIELRNLRSLKFR